jgi:hypothetical protein
MVRHVIATAALFLVLGGCQLPEERAPLRPLPEDTGPLPYAQLLTRARQQASVATEAFYVNRWMDIEDAAKGLDQTARFLPKAEDVPAKQKELIPAVSEELKKEAAALTKAAQAKDEKEVNNTLQRIHLAVRKLRLDQ